MLHTGYNNGAIACSEQTETMHQTDGEIWYRQGEMQVLMESYAAALISVDRALDLNPNYQKAWVLRGSVLIALARYAEALESYNQAIRLCPHDTETWVMRGVALQRMGQYRQAYASYDKALGVERISFLEQSKVGVRSLLKIKRFMDKVLAAG